MYENLIMCQYKSLFLILTFTDVTNTVTYEQLKSNARLSSQMKKDSKMKQIYIVHIMKHITVHFMLQKLYLFFHIVTFYSYTLLSMVN